ncbi:crossover junction endodeoxyribonuclease RuvC [Thermosulfuriphilus sp.]
MRVVGIDPGSRICAYGVVEETPAGLKLLEVGFFDLTKVSWPQRLNILYQGLKEVFEGYQPQAAAFEDLFVSRNPRSALKLGQARGVALLAAVSLGIPVYEYSPSRIKQAISAYGRAPKEQVHQALKFFFPDSDLSALKADEADALAVALCHLFSQRFESLIFEAL